MKIVATELASSRKLDELHFCRRLIETTLALDGLLAASGPPTWFVLWYFRETADAP